MTPTEQQKLLASLGADVEAEVLAAYNRAMELMRRGTAPRDAIQQVMDNFTGEYAGLMSEALSAVLQQSVGTASVLAIQVGQVSLSRRLYAEAQDVSNVVQGIVQRHVAGMQDARRLALELFEGYNFRDPAAEPLQINRRNRDLPRYLREVILTDDRLEREVAKAMAKIQVDDLTTPALRAAYSGVLEALDDLTDGVARDVLEKRLKVAFFERVRYFAERIARTELHKAYAEREASILLDDEEIEYVQVRRSRTGKDPCICSLITGRDQYGLGTGVYPKAVAPNPPFHPFCLPGNALITSAVNIAAVSKRWYDGDMVVITTASNHRLTATVNHPVLTSAGWIAAGLLHVGGNVISRVDTKAIAGYSFMDDQHQHVPASIAEIADAFFSSSEVATREVPLTAEHFHGDGMAGKVAVIGANRKLWDRVNASATQGMHDSLLVFADGGLTRLLGDGRFDQRLKAALRSSKGVVGVCSNCEPLVFGELAHSDDVGFAQAAKLDSGLNEPALNDVAADAELARYIQDGSTGNVLVDDVVNVERYAFSGHVYNLETEQGHYTCNGIVTHNCRCISSPRLDLTGRKQPKEKENADQYFLRRINKPIAAQIVGSKAKLQRVLDGESAIAVANESKDPAYRIINLEQAANAFAQANT